MTSVGLFVVDVRYLRFCGAFYQIYLLFIDNIQLILGNIPLFGTQILVLHWLPVGVLRAAGTHFFTLCLTHVLISHASKPVHNH